MGYFLEKSCKNCQSIGGSTPNSPLASDGWGSISNIELLFSYIIATSKS